MNNYILVRIIGKNVNNYIKWLFKNKIEIIDLKTIKYNELRLFINYKEYDLCNKQLHNLSPKVFQEYLNSLAEKYSRASILKIW